MGSGLILAIWAVCIRPFTTHGAAARADPRCAGSIPARVASQSPVAKRCRRSACRSMRSAQEPSEKNLAWLCNFRLSGPIIACGAAAFLLDYTCEQ